MKISDLLSAKKLKIKLTLSSNPNVFPIGSFIEINETQMKDEFLIKPYGPGVITKDIMLELCKTDNMAAEYLHDLIDGEKKNVNRIIFAVEGVNSSSLEVQIYLFRSIIEYKTPIYVQVSNELLSRSNLVKLNDRYIWDELGMPAIFCLNYKNRKKQLSDVRFTSGRRQLISRNTPRGIIAESEGFIKQNFDLPIDIYIAPEIKFVEINDGIELNDSLARDLDMISNSAKYINRWDAYNELSKKILEKENEEFGEIHYTSYTFTSDLAGVNYEFVVDEKYLDDSLIGKKLGARQQQNENKDSQDTRNKTISVGEVKKVKNKSIVTHSQAFEGLSEIPDVGVLSLYQIGDKIIMNRRDSARKRMVESLSPIKSITKLIEYGVSDYDTITSWKGYKPITQELMRNFKKASILNREQIDAIDVAINTPDIALIQGPPGTGKTTVIKAICERFREIYEAKEQEELKMNTNYILQSPKILLSSFQNEAVDNAISTPLPGDLPAYRKMAKSAKESTKKQYQASLDNWYTSLSKSLSELIQNKAASEYVINKSRLQDMYMSYKNSGESLGKAVSLIKHYLSYTDITYPKLLKETAVEIIKITNRENEEEQTPDLIIAKLESLRTVPEAFADDGKLNVQRLLAHLKFRDDLVIDQEIIASLQAVCEDAFSDTEFSEYVNSAQKLQKQYCSSKLRVNIENKRVVNECILSLEECFSNQYVKTLTDIESKKSIVLAEFSIRLEQEYEQIVKKYATTIAATCQTSLNLRESNMEVYDLVIVDEAARANPLDLFIPMSMGKKIILVGDHKQLPHMLEPDVLKILQDDPKFSDLPDLEKSLFERLFEMFAKGHKPKSVLLTHQYRMHPKICNFVSEIFYEGRLKTSDSITSDLRASSTRINNGEALTFVNVPISRGKESFMTSYSRKAEVDAIIKDIKTILENDLEASIGIITFYQAQSKIINDCLGNKLNEVEFSRVEVGTVDAFQGKEFDYVMLSCVRSNKPEHEGELPNVGFLVKPNRLCVAFSRAKKQLIVYGDVETLIQIPCFSRLYEICNLEGGGCYREY